VRRCILALALLASATTAAQRRFGYGIPILPNPRYDGQFTFVRLRYGPPTAFASQQIPWSHDYPTGERHFMQILNEMTLLRPKLEETIIYGFEDKALFRYPVAYMAEPGFLRLTDEEAAGFRAYLQKGGFVIFDDFAENRGGWYAFNAEMQHVLPGARWFELDGTHPIFHAFFEIDNPLDLIPPYDQQYHPVYYGLFEDNDPKKRLMAIANYNNDISEYWEFSATGLMPIADTNEAYKLGVNYVVYAMTH
jgi:uncharacterized protein DUF4159